MSTDFRQPRMLGRSGLTVGRLGLGSSYGGTAGGYERAFEQGCNYFYWGSIRREAFGAAIRNLAARQRDKLVVVLQSYSRWGTTLSGKIESSLRRLKLEYADILLLGCHNQPLGGRLIDAAQRLKDRGLARHVAVSCHHRPTFQQHAQTPLIEALMVRYNAAHRGAEQQVFPFLANMPGPKPGVVTYTATRWATLMNPKFSPPGSKTPTAIDCYRFVLSNPSVDVCLTGPATDEQLDANLRVLDLGPMSDEEMQWMRAIGDHVHRLTASRSRNPFMQREQ